MHTSQNTDCVVCGKVAVVIVLTTNDATSRFPEGKQQTKMHDTSILIHFKLYSMLRLLIAGGPHDQET